MEICEYMISYKARLPSDSSLPIYQFYTKQVCLHMFEKFCFSQNNFRSRFPVRIRFLLDLVVLI